MAKFEIDIPSKHLSRVKAALLGLHPVPLVKGEEMDDDENPIMVPEFTETAWMKRLVINFLKKKVLRFERKKSAQAVSAADINMT
jgi:hypothetical protein